MNNAQWPAAWKQRRAPFIGTPQGHNHFHDLVERAPTLPDWEECHHTTARGGNVTRQELESVARELDERTYSPPTLDVSSNFVTWAR